MNMFKSNPAKTPEEYIDTLLEPRKTQFQTLFDFIKKTLPNKKPFMQSGMIGFVSFHYKYASGREGDWPVVALSSRKDYISIYLCASDGKEYLVETYKNKLPKANIGKSCIRIKDLSHLDLKILEEIIIKGVRMVKEHGLTF